MFSDSDEKDKKGFASSVDHFLRKSIATWKSSISFLALLTFQISNFLQNMQIIIRDCVTLHISIYSYLCSLLFYEWHDIWLPEFFRSDIAFCGKNSLHSRRSKRTSSYNFFLQYTKTDSYRRSNTGQPLVIEIKLRPGLTRCFDKSTQNLCSVVHHLKLFWSLEVPGLENCKSPGKMPTMCIYFIVRQKFERYLGMVMKLKVCLNKSLQQFTHAGYFCCASGI